MSNTKATYTEVSEYYDKNWADLDKKKLAGVNDRHRHTLKYFVENGLKRNHKVLEIGCGIATVTNMLADWLKEGSILGVDISPETIELVKHRFKDVKNIRFMVSDMTSFSSDEKFDVVIFPDVLEHIPLEAHDNIFRTITSILKPDGKVFINIPEPSAIEYLQIHHKDLLQIIDQAVHSDQLIPLAYKYGLYLENVTSYNVYFDHPDYQFLSFRKNKELTSLKELSKRSVFINRVKIIISNFWMNLNH